MSQRLLKISLLIKILFCLCFWLPWLNEIHCLVFQLADLFSYLIHSAVESLQCIFQFSCNPWSCKESDITERLHFFLFFLFSTFLYFLSLDWNSHCSSILLPSLVSIFMTITLNSLSAILFIFVLINSFLRFLSCSFDWNLHSTVSSFCLILCVRFCILVISAMSLSLEGLTLFRRCPVWLRILSYMSTRAGIQAVSPM